jgi:hypothetical protein
MPAYVLSQFSTNRSQHAWNSPYSHILIKTSHLQQKEFITKDYFPKHTNIGTKLKQKLFTN